MKYSDFVLTRYDADEGKLFDFKEPRYEDVIGEDGKPTGEQIQTHLYTKTLFIGGETESITNYIEVDAEGVATECVEPEDATHADYLAALAELGVE
jgi:hypothetical protein